jgi:hypothetical protein
MAIPLKTWQAAREDYISGGGSLRAISAKHGLNPATVEKRARREEWSELRRQRDDALRTGTPPPAFPPAYAPPTPMGEPLSETWLQEKRRNHFLETQSLIENTRAKLREKLGGDGLDCDELARLANALDTLADAETRVLGIRDTRKDKPRRRSWQPVEPIFQEPLLVPTPEPVVTDSPTG